MSKAPSEGALKLNEMTFTECQNSIRGECKNEV